MNGLFASGIRDMYGPHFLALYAAVIVVTLATAWWIRRRADRTLDLSPLSIPPRLDPLEVAYLRGGTYEATRFVVFDLLRRGHLRFSEKDRLEQSDNATAVRHLSPLERDIHTWFSTPRSAGDLFKPAGLAAHVQGHCDPYDSRFEAEGFLTPREAKIAGAIAFLGGALVVVGLGAYKLVAALQKGRHNVGFLIILGILALLVLAVVCVPPRLSRRGKIYLEELQGAFGQLKDRVSTLAASPDESAWPVLVGVYGIAALTGTEYSPFADMFRRSQAAGGWSSGCGGASGGCGGGGGGCGGGCGGCGG